MALENRVRYCQFDSSYLLHFSPTHRKASDEPAEDCFSRDYSVRELAVHCGFSVAPLSRLTIGVDPNSQDRDKVRKRQSLTETHFLEASAPVV